MDGAAHLAAIGGVAIAGFQVGFGMDGHHITGFVLVPVSYTHLLGRPFTEEKGKLLVPFWGKLPFHIFRKSN